MNIPVKLFASSVLLDPLTTDAVTKQSDLQKKEAEYYKLLEIRQIKKREYFTEILQTQEKIEIFLKQKSKKSIQKLFEYAVMFSDAKTIKFIMENSSVNINGTTNAEMPLLHTAIMRWRHDIDITKLFFNHPKIDFFAVNEWSDNLFHAAFLGSMKASQRISLLKFLFKPENFIKIHRLLNAVNTFKETPMDFFIRETAHGDNIQSLRYVYPTYQMLQEKGAQHTIEIESINKILQKSENLMTPRTSSKSKSNCKVVWIY